MTYSIYAENLFADGKWEKKKIVYVKNGVIDDIRDSNGGNADYTAEFLSPALVDNHIHGGNGFSAIPDEEGLINWLLYLAKSGVGGVLYAPIGSVEELHDSLVVVKKVMTMQQSGKIGGARLLGVHFEGPFLSKERPGSFREDVLFDASVELYKTITLGNEDVVKEMSVAPELDGAEEVIKHLKETGVRVLAGHTDAGYDKAMESFSWGVGAITHTFNAARPIHHREPGVITAGLVSPDIYCEAICDLEHLNPGTIKLIKTCKGREHMMVISDAVTTTNCPDGIYDDCGVVIEVKNGVSRAKELGCLNGGGCYISKSVKNLVKIGFSFEDAIMAASVNPARWLGFDVSVKCGKKAFFTAWNKDFVPTFNFIDNNTYECDALC